MSGAEPHRLEIGPLLGSGGFGDVYRATECSPGGLRTTVALKVLHRAAAHASDAANRLRDEARLLARIRHPVVVQAFDLITVDDRLGLVTEFVEGLDLEGCIDLSPPLPPRPLMRVLARVAAALDAAWSAMDDAGQPLHIVHRDIKPANIRVGRDGQVRLLDFGIALFNSADRNAETHSDVMVGSMPYMAPERFVARSKHAAVDVFGLGCCAFEALGPSAFLADLRLRELTALALSEDDYTAHLDRRLAQLAQPPDLVDLVRACLSYRPSARPSAPSVVERCEALGDQLSGPSLHRWCAEAPWPPPPSRIGTLSGRSVPRDPASSAEVPPRHRDVGRPRRIERPPTTAEPAMVLDGASMSNRRSPPDDTPEAPPAFPSIPLGTALEQLQISEQEAEALRTPPPAPVRFEREPMPEAEIILEPLTAPAPEGPRPLTYALVAGGCALLAMTSTVALAAVVGVVLAMAVGGL
ncbi:MAG: protein kinase [Myxococcales bacterium]|nr:protein kinase [Myxococcales bacterium]